MKAAEVVSGAYTVTIGWRKRAIVAVKIATGAEIQFDSRNGSWPKTEQVERPPGFGAGGDTEAEAVLTLISKCLAPNPPTKFFQIQQQWQQST